MPFYGICWGRCNACRHRQGQDMTMERTRRGRLGKGRERIIGDPTLADAILDRLVHAAYRIKLKGESMRKKKARLT
jgi:hypothetical protein